MSSDCEWRYQSMSFWMAFLVRLLNCQSVFIWGWRDHHSFWIISCIFETHRHLHLLWYLQDSCALYFVEPVCKHIRKGLEQSHLKKALLNVEWHVCQDCKADNKTQEKSEEETDESPSIWLCLKCGHRVSLVLLLISIDIFQCLIIEWNDRTLVE